MCFVYTLILSTVLAVVCSIYGLSTLEIKTLMFKDLLLKQVSASKGAPKIKAY